MNTLLFSFMVIVAAPPVAWLDLSPEDPAWVDQDRTAREEFEKQLRLATAGGLLDSRQAGDYFREAPPPGVDSLLTSAREDLQRGREFQEQLKPDRAIQHLQAALKTLRGMGAALSDLTLLEEAHFLLGTTYQSLGKNASADEQYRMVLLLRPDRVLDEAEVNPLVVERFELVRQNLSAALPGSISVISQPPSGRVTLDGRPVGRTPLTLSGVLPGEHYLSLELDGYRSWFGLVQVASGGLEKKEIYPEEGARIERVRLRNRLRDAGAINAPLADAQALCQGLGVDWLVLTRLTRREGQTYIEAGIYSRTQEEVGRLGPYPATRKALSEATQNIAAWMRGERPQQIVIKPPELPLDRPPPVPPPSPPAGTPWYRTWWFWTAVGGVALSAAAVTTGLLLSRDQGVRVEVLR
ncbi:MAG: PEGA domain-containing protein [Myxococcales bacterium]|nr:PEGA domain-containing protein [Myxococcales bacterium]